MLDVGERLNRILTTMMKDELNIEVYAYEKLLRVYFHDGTDLDLINDFAELLRSIIGPQRCRFLVYIDEDNRELFLECKVVE